MLCSRAGIARMPSGEVYITESCIGCGICAERCPYDNISIVTLDELEGAESRHMLSGSVQQLLYQGAGKERRLKSCPMAQYAPRISVRSTYASADAFERDAQKARYQMRFVRGLQQPGLRASLPNRSRLPRPTRLTFLWLNRRYLTQRAR